MSPDVPVVAVRRIAAPPERVFDAWLDAEQARRFLFATPTGTMVRAEVDGRPGGTFRMVDRRGEVEVDHSGRFVEIDRPRRLSFDFTVDASPETRVTVGVAPADARSVVTVSTALPAHLSHFADRARAGWESILDSLARVVEDGRG